MVMDGKVHIRCVVYQFLIPIALLRPFHIQSGICFKMLNWTIDSRAMFQTVGIAH